MTITWTKNAKRLMNLRDHYARDAIEVDFSKNHDREAVPVDTQHRYFVTPVANYRYSVIWKKDQNDVVVEAVLPGEFSPDDQGNLIDRVKKAVEHESNGYVTFIP